MKKNRSFIYHIVSLLLVLVLTGGLGLTPANAQPTAGTLQPVIVQAFSAEQAAQLVAKHGGSVTSTLEIINGVGAQVPAQALAALRGEPGITGVTANAETALADYSFDAKRGNNAATDYPDVIGADFAWQAGELGSGVAVAVIDTGIAQHPALKKDVNGKPRSVVTGWVDFVDGKKSPTDPNGHGTHIAGVIANASKGTDGEWNGIAPGANLVGVRVLDKNGAGNYETVIQGIQWVVDHKAQYNIRVINLSLHSLVQSPYWADPLDQAVMRAWAAGITVVVAAGNEGPQAMSIAVPGNTPYAITVGAFTDNYTPNDWSDDYLTSFSAAGPTLDGFVKPDLLAPGAHITSTMMPGSQIARNHEASWVSSQYFSMAGTSQAAAVVSGASALVIAHNPSLTPDQVKYRLMVTSLPWVNADQTDTLYSVWQQGAGRLNAYDAVFADDINGSANQGLDIQADLNGTKHFEGYSYYDPETGTYRLHGAEDMTSGYGAWAGGYGAWAGGYGAWAGGYGAWAGGYGAWAGGYGAWAGGYGAWAGGYGAWAGGYGAWAGGYGAWAGGYGAWAGGYGAWAGNYADPQFYQNFVNGVSPNVKTSTASVRWLDEK